MCVIIVRCPDCGSLEIVRYGYGKKGQQRYKCKNKECKTRIFQIKYKNKGCERGVEGKIIKMAANANGIRDTSRIAEHTEKSIKFSILLDFSSMFSMGISKYKVINTLKKQNLS